MFPSISQSSKTVLLVALVLLVPTQAYFASACTCKCHFTKCESEFSTSCPPRLHACCKTCSKSIGRHSKAIAKLESQEVQDCDCPEKCDCLHQLDPQSIVESSDLGLNNASLKCAFINPALDSDAQFTRYNAAFLVNLDRLSLEVLCKLCRLNV